MQKGTVCGADRSVYKLNFFIGFFCIFALNSFQCFIFVKGLGLDICLKCLHFLPQCKGQSFLHSQIY